MREQFITHSDMPDGASFGLALGMVGFYCFAIGAVSWEVASVANEYIIEPVTGEIDFVKESLGLE